MSITIPRAAELRAPRRGYGGKPYIGPKVQAHVPEDDYDGILEVMEARGWCDEQYPDMVREVISRGLASIRGGA